MNLTRRTFLTQAALGSLVVAQSTLHAAQEKMPQVIPFCFSLYGMRGLTLDAALEAAAAHA